MESAIPWFFSLHDSILSQVSQNSKWHARRKRVDVDCWPGRINKDWGYFSDFWWVLGLEWPCRSMRQSAEQSRSRIKKVYEEDESTS